MKKTLLFYIIFVLVLISTFFILGCREWEPVKLKNQPDACTDFYTLFRDSKIFLTGTKSSLLSLITLSYNKCNIDRDNEKKIKERKEIIKNCVKIIYDKKQLSKKEDRSRYVDFLECMNNLENIK